VGGTIGISVDVLAPDVVFLRIVWAGGGGFRPPSLFELDRFGQQRNNNGDCVFWQRDVVGTLRLKDARRSNPCSRRSPSSASAPG
jgi:hypothetical protein